MTTSKFLKVLAVMTVGFSAFAGSGVALAQALTGVRVETPQGQPGRPVTILVDIDKADNASISCGAVINFGDGNTRDLRIEGATFPLRVEHTYAAPGSFAVTVEGKTLFRGLRTASACSGPVRSTVAQVGAAGGSVAQAGGGAPPAPAPAGGGATAAAQSDPSFVLVNRSSTEIAKIFVSSAQQRNWGRDLLGDNVLQAGQQFKVAPPRDQGCIFDVRVEYPGNRFEERRGQDLCQLEQIVFDGSSARVAQSTQKPVPQAPAATTLNPDFYVVNRSSKVIRGLFVSSVQSPNWGEELMSGTLEPGQRYQAKLERNGQCMYDVRVIYQDRTVEEKRGQDVCKIEDMVFTGQTAQAAGQQGGAPAQSGPQVAGFGTGFFVSGQGHALTNNHVVAGCERVASVLEGQIVPSIVVQVDRQNDLALVRAQVSKAVPFAKFRASPGIRVGEDVVAAGFPFPQVLQNGMNVTRGNVSAMGGIGGNTANMQMTAPVQPGNSGGPLFDSSGNIVGVVVSRLNSQAVKSETQNMNYAVQGPVARLFLESNGVRPTEIQSTRDIKIGDLSDAAREFTFQIVCYKSR
jgi:serine protease Do